MTNAFLNFMIEHAPCGDRRSSLRDLVFLCLNYYHKIVPPGLHALIVCGTTRFNSIGEMLKQPVETMLRVEHTTISIPWARQASIKSGATRCSDGITEILTQSRRDEAYGRNEKSNNSPRGTAFTNKSMMRNYIKCIFLLFLILGSIAEMTAQVYPVQGTAALIPPYALRLSDYATSVNERFVVNTLLADVTKAELHVRFKISIVGQNVKLETKPEYIGSPIILQGGIPLRLTNIELAEYFDPNHLNFSGISKTDFLKTGFLPEGFYQFCFEVYEYNRGVKISNTICAPAWLILNDPPIVNLPRNGEKLKPLSPQNVLLQWTPRHTGSPNAAFTTEYDVKVVEVWPANRNPNDAILTQLAIFETTTHSTTLVYGPDATQLEPGRVYAFRVQARAMAGAEQLDLFKNNGYSETVTFIYGDACDAPVNIVAEASTPTRISLQWDTSPSQTGYTVQYRVKGQANGTWYSQSSLMPSAEISGLKPNTNYEYQVMSACGSFESAFGNIASITTPDMSQKGYSCGAPLENFNLDPSQLIPVLKVGEVIDAGDFDVTITKITGGNGVFSGAGEVVVPFLNQVKGRVTFDNITVNNDRRMVRGYMNVTGGGIDIVPSGVLSLMDQLSQSLSAADSILALARQYVTPAPDQNTFVADQVITIPAGIKTVQKDPLTGNIVVVDNNGQTHTIDPGKNVAITDGSGNGVIVNKEGGKTNVSGPQLAAVLKREYNLNLTFAKTSGTRYGLDEQKLEALKTNYEKLNDTYYVSWKAVSSILDPVVATYNAKENLSDKIKFEFDGAPATAVANGNSFTINIAAATTQTPISLVAKAANGDKEQILGKLNVIGYDAKPVNLKIVKVNGATFDMKAEDVKAQLDKIYSQAVVSWNVEVVPQPLQVSGLADPFDDGSSGLLSNYTSDMKNVINTYGELQADTYYLFVIDEPASATKLGYMPRAKKVGFIFAEPHNNNATLIVNTMAHELGHGAFTLKHTFDEYATLYKGTTENLMDYNNGTSLWKYQWDRIHDPAVVLGLFEGDDAGASYACQYNWFDLAMPSKDCDNVGKVLERIRTAVSSGKKVQVQGSRGGKEQLIANSIKLDDTDYKTIQIQNFVENDMTATFDPTEYDDYTPNSVTTDRMVGFSYKVDGKLVFKISLDDKESEIEKKRTSLRKYLYSNEIFLSSVTFTSQFNESLFGSCTGCWKNSCCMRAAQYMLGNTAVANCTNATIAQSSPNLAVSEVITTASFADNSTNYTLDSYNEQILSFDVTRAETAIKYIKERLRDGKPILMGCHYKADKGDPPNNPNRATRHFMIIVGTGLDTQGKTQVRFYDPGVFPESEAIGTDPDNLLVFDSSTGAISGTYRGRTYSITEIFKTN